MIEEKKYLSVLVNHRSPVHPSGRTFPKSDNHEFQYYQQRARRQEQFRKNIDIIVRYERRKRMKMLLADLGPTYLENLRIESTPYLKVA